MTARHLLPGNDFPGQFRDFVEAAAAGDFLQTVTHHDGSKGIGKAGGTHSNGGGTGHHQLGSIAALGHTAHAQHGDLHGVGDLPDHADGHGSSREVIEPAQIYYMNKV